MRITIWLSLWAGVVAGNLTAATIEYQVTNLGGTSYRYDYFISGVSFLMNQGFDIQFPYPQYGALSNGVAGSDFTLYLLQPNNPSGAPGHYTAVANMDGASLAASFRVDFVFPSGVPGAQSFTIDQYDSLGGFVSNISSGTTTPFVAGVPEPGSLGLVGLVLLMGLVIWTVRRRRVRAFP